MTTTRRDGQSSVDARDPFARDELSERRETFKSLKLFSSGAGFIIRIHEKDSVASSTRRRGCVYLEAALSSSDVVAASKNSAKNKPVALNHN